MSKSSGGVMGRSRGERRKYYLKRRERERAELERIREQRRAQYGEQYGTNAELFDDAEAKQ